MHSLDPLALKLVRLLESDRLELEEKTQKGLKLARFLKRRLLWGVLAVFSLSNRDTNTAEICLGHLENVEKVKFLGEINQTSDDTLS